MWMRCPTASRLMVVLVLTGAEAAADLPTLDIHPDFPSLRVNPLRIEGPLAPAGTTGVTVLDRSLTLNNQILPAGTLLSSFGTVNGGAGNRIYAIDPNTGAVLPDLSIHYGPASSNGRPDAGLLLFDNDRYLSFQFGPVGINLGRFEPDAPGRLLDTELLPGEQFSNGGGMGLLDEDTLYVTSWREHALYTVDFSIDGDDLSLTNLQLVNPFLPGLGPDGVAVIPANAAGELANFAGNLVIARFGGSVDGFVDIFSPQGVGLRRIATYRKNDRIGFIGPDGVAFGPDGSLFISDFDQTIFKVTAIPEPATLILLVLGAALFPWRRAHGTFLPQRSQRVRRRLPESASLLPQAQ